MIIHEQLGLHHEHALVQVDTARSMRDEATGERLPVQSAPATALDAAQTGELHFVRIDLLPMQRRVLHPHNSPAPAPAAFEVTREGDRIVIRCGDQAVAIPASGIVNPPFPGPILGLQHAGGEWFAGASLCGASSIGAVETVIESIGACFVQWRTTLRWGNERSLKTTVRWAAGSDTLVVVDEVVIDTDSHLEFLPFGDLHAQTYVGGGGEGTGPMRALKGRVVEGAAKSAQGSRLLGRLGHVSYFNQWNLAWAGFGAEDDERFIGVFTGASSLWLGRGRARIEIIESERGHWLRLPLRRGRRVWGLCFGTRSAAGVDAENRRTLLNVRKTQLFDLPLNKVLGWQLGPPADEGKPSLLREADIAQFRARTAQDPQVAAALATFNVNAEPSHPGACAAAAWSGDTQKMRAAARQLESLSDYVFGALADGGYERLIIFQGRVAKRVAYDLDLLRACHALEPALWQRVGRALLVLAYAFDDPDYCRHEDSVPERDDPDEFVAESLLDEMGDCPVPPNFFSEFFSTVGVVAELFPAHPRAAHWRRSALAQLDRFIERWFEADGTYLESINYHTHGFNELLCQIYPLTHKRVRNFCVNPRFRGSFEHFLQLLTPPLIANLPTLGEPGVNPAHGRVPVVSADWKNPLRAVLPADGNSGGHAIAQEVRGDFSVGAAMFADSDPDFAARLANAWRLAGKPILDHDHPALTLVSLDPAIVSQPEPFVSVHRRSLGIVSKAVRASGYPIWAFFRAGHCTHHMDFDQGNFQLIAGDTLLLGDHGYHTHDNDHRSTPAAATWLHNTLTYHEDRNMSSGYTGLERAPDPLTVCLTERLDWCVHRIVNNNFRDLRRLAYVDRIPALTTVHIRQYLFVKPDYIIIRDTFDESHSPATFWLHPTHALEQIGPATFRSNVRGEKQLLIQFVEPAEPRVIENSQQGPLWSLAVQQPSGRPFMAVLHPQLKPCKIETKWDESSRVLDVTGEEFSDTITFPAPASIDAPQINRANRR